MQHCPDMPQNGTAGALGAPAKISSFFFNFFWSPKWPRIVPPGPGGPWGVFSGYFWPILGPPGGIFFSPLPPISPYFPILGSCAVGSTSGALCTGPSHKSAEKVFQSPKVVCFLSLY